MSPPASILWFRQDLRLADNPALTAALERGAPIIPVFVWAPEEDGRWAAGGASCWWLHQSLAQLDADLRTRDSRLILRVGGSLATLRDLARECGAGAVFWNRRYEPAAIARDTEIKTALREDGLVVDTCNAALLHEPWTVRTQADKPFQVFTPFWKACLRAGTPADPLPAPDAIASPARWPRSASLAALGLEPKIDWAAGMRTAWQPGEAGAAAQLERFLDDGLAGYDEARNRPDVPGSSRLSPHLHFGEIGPRQVLHAVEHRAALDGTPGLVRGAESYLREIGWREFAHHLIFHFPHTAVAPLRAEFAHFPWADDPAGLKAWQRGRTGYPLVDAGMRELWATGWMHNRVRMVVASFLVKDLLLPWQAGADWFWDTLVDADLANNTLGWQWTAGCGADAAPYFRIFNPVSQGEKFDPDGTYVRRWVPQLARLPKQWVHKPWQAPAAVLADAGVEIGRTYPAPIVDHGAARHRALAALATITKPGPARVR
jgi:deoxyribodipyrimidine photo-lyase